jgi:hypothetical protein
MKSAAAVLVALLAAPVAASAQAPVPVPGPGETPPAATQQPPPGGKMSVRLASGMSEGRVRYVARGQRILVRGAVEPYVEGERYVVELRRRGRVVASRTVQARPDGSVGRFTVRFKVRRPGGHAIRARHDASSNQGAFAANRRSFRSLAGGARRGSRGVRVRLLQRGLARLGFVTPRGGRFDDATRRGVLAFRKTNRMARTGRANAPVFRMLMEGRGGYRLRYPRAGKHVEVDISRQVLVLARGGKPERVYHASTGKASTPTVLGTFRFYRKQPGTNSHGMVHSNYFIRGYAIHGYASVPTYPASHGCVRVPIPNARSIYNWINMGDRIYVYR